MEKYLRFSSGLPICAPAHTHTHTHLKTYIMFRLEWGLYVLFAYF